jgi:hypothetical protein
VARAIENVSIEVRLPTVTDVDVSCKTPLVVPTRKSIRGNEVEAPPASVAFPTNLAHPATPIAEPKSFQVSVDFDNTPSTAGLVKVKPFVAAPADHAAPSLVIFPRSEPDTAESASAGGAPLYTKIHPVVKIELSEPVVNSMVLAPVLRLIFAILIVASP